MCRKAETSRSMFSSSIFGLWGLYFTWLMTWSYGLFNDMELRRKTTVHVTILYSQMPITPLLKCVSRESLEDRLTGFHMGDAASD
uniref:Uncharacterized protein n=1 Tax=Physcomitrium patens TaxID=3218 RepID=A0A2K1KL68_PHYPA|nr:hypothetical protein PHYPA_008199 [Physcomitrium patens]